jgi:hypothetical protein
MYVYAVVSAGRSPETFRSRSGERFRLVRRGAVAAVVSERARPSAPSPANLRRYDRTMREFAERFPAIIPARFGTWMAEEELITTLSSRRAVLAGALASVRGRVQMTVRVVAGRGSRKGDGGHALSGASEAPTSITGRDYLKARARAAAAARVVPGFEPVRDAVVRWVRDERVEHRGAVSSVYHLIPRASTDAYRRAAQTSADAAGLRVIISGPWPPYAFSGPE